MFSDTQSYEKVKYLQRRKLKSASANELKVSIENLKSRIPVGKKVCDEIAQMIEQWKVECEAPGSHPSAGKFFWRHAEACYKL